jgi:hypothetical protein
VLGQNVETLGKAVGQLSTLPPDAPVRQGWDALSELFERAEGQDLRELISSSIARWRLLNRGMAGRGVAGGGMGISVMRPAATA